MPETDPDVIISVRMSQLRKPAKEISAMTEAGLLYIERQTRIPIA